MDTHDATQSSHQGHHHDHPGNYQEESENERLEREHFETVLRAFYYYEYSMTKWLTKKQTAFLSIPARHRALIQGRNEHMRNVQKGIKINAKFIAEIVDPTGSLFADVVERETRDVGSDNSSSSTKTDTASSSEGDAMAVVDSTATQETSEHSLNAPTHDCHSSHGHSHQHQHQHQHQNEPHDLNDWRKRARGRVPHSDMDKVKATLRQFARDWSVEGRSCREQCYGPLLRGLEDMFPTTDEDERRKIKVLCPGSGLGRLPWEVAKRGYASQGNEFSYYMLVPANSVLNRLDRVNMLEICPYIHSFSNIMKESDMTKVVTIPDVVPADLPPNSDFSMCAGDFVEVYGDDEEMHNGWDCVLTCFFVDTAHNIAEYAESIYKILKPGGAWINLGPLLYHYSDMPGELSIEITYEQLRDVVVGLGFNLGQEKVTDCYYTPDEHLMMRVIYKGAYFVATKPME